MRYGCLLFALLVGLGGVCPARADTATPAQGQSEQIEKLIQQLGSARFTEREKASHDLQRIGEPALGALRKAVRSDDLETSRRAGELVKRMEEKLLTASLLAPRRVRLDLKDAPVTEAIAELSKQSGYPIQIEGVRASLAKRKITLNTGATTFWQAFDQLCAQASVVEATPPNPYEPGPFPIRPLPRVKARPLPAPVLPQVQAVPAVARVYNPYLPGSDNGQVTVKDGKSPHLPTHYAGSVRIRALPPDTEIPGVTRNDGEVLVILEVSAEPRLEGFTVVGNPSIDKATDDRGQTLVMGMDPDVVANAAPAFNRFGWIGRPLSPLGPRHALVRLKAGANQAKALTELSGSLSAQVQMPTEALLKVDNILKAAGNQIRGGNGGSLEVMSVQKEANGDYRLQVRLQDLPGINAVGGGVQFIQGGGQVQIQQVQMQLGGAGMPLHRNEPAKMLSLLDAKGQAYQLVQIPSHTMRGVNGVITQEWTLLYRPQNNQGEPATLVLNGQRSVTVQVPFRLEHVPLP